MQTNDGAGQTQSALQRRTDCGLAAGLLPVLQQAAALRLALALLAMAAYWPTLSGVPLGLVMLSTVERALLLAAAWLPAVRRTLGRQFLPLMLVWLLTVPQIEWAVSLLLSGGVMAPFPNSLMVNTVGQSGQPGSKHMGTWSLPGAMSHITPCPSRGQRWRGTAIVRWRYCQSRSGIRA